MTMSVLRKGDNMVGVFHVPGMKKPHIGYQIGNCVHDCGRFNNEDAAERFMNALCDMVGIKNKENDDETD